jgi:hypothetical protein
MFLVTVTETSVVAPAFPRPPPGAFPPFPPWIVRSDSETCTCDATLTTWWATFSLSTTPAVPSTVMVLRVSASVPRVSL